MQLIHGLHFDNIGGDIYGGLTAAVFALPLALAFGVASGAGPIAGLYGAIFVGLFAALFGGTPAQVSAPRPAGCSINLVRCRCCRPTTATNASARRYKRPPERSVISV